MMKRLLVLLAFVLGACQATTQPLTPAPAQNSFQSARAYTDQLVAQVNQPNSLEVAMRPTLPPTFTPTSTPLDVASVRFMTNTPLLAPTRALSATPMPTQTQAAIVEVMPLATAYRERLPEQTVADQIAPESMVDFLLDTPSLYIPDEAHLRLIYERGQARNLQSDFMLSVGDCNTESRFFLQPLVSAVSSDGVADLYLQREDVQELIAYYEPTFAHKAESANSGFNALSVFDPLWTRNSACNAGESPLACDVRLHQPFSMLIMFGANDVLVLNTRGYEQAVRDMIEYSLDQDIIPILSTFTYRTEGTINFEKALRMNVILRLLAEEYQIPLVNVWKDARALPDRGILPDNAHMTIEGFEVRNQLALEMLRYLRGAVIEYEGIPEYM